MLNILILHVKKIQFLTYFGLPSKVVVARAGTGQKYQDQFRYTLVNNEAGPGQERVRTRFCPRGLAGLPNTTQQYYYHE